MMNIPFRNDEYGKKFYIESDNDDESYAQIGTQAQMDAF